eukprot:TRINITY_DN1398_c2_g1_i4.p1 TRINITY_DN1398_c2_g1~~TRINITY_DN1398_c2_g1_i4.p1  ORF type:complete len:101 (-),score=8.90 TRINITY_DN1398_c2_g1_i4:2662-2964(-)
MCEECFLASLNFSTYQSKQLILLWKASRQASAPQDVVHSDDFAPHKSLLPSNRHQLPTFRLSKQNGNCTSSFLSLNLDISFEIPSKNPYKYRFSHKKIQF